MLGFIEKMRPPELLLVYGSYCSCPVNNHNVASGSGCITERTMGLRAEINPGLMFSHRAASISSRHPHCSLSLSISLSVSETVTPEDHSLFLQQKRNTKKNADIFFFSSRSHNLDTSFTNSFPVNLPRNVIVLS